MLDCWLDLILLEYRRRYDYGYGCGYGGMD